MSYTLDPSTLWGQVRYLIGDTNSTNPAFTDEDLRAFLNIGEQSIYLAAAYCCDSLASQVSVNFESVTIGDYQNDSASQVKALQTQADRFRTIERESPAFAAVEENLSGFNELNIIRNWVLRTEA